MQHSGLVAQRNVKKKHVWDFFKVWASLFRQTRLPPSPPPRRVGVEIHSRPFFRFISFPKVGVMCYRGTKVAEQFRFLPFSFVASFHPHPPLPVRPPLCCLPPPVTSCLLASRPTTNFAWNWKIGSDWKKKSNFCRRTRNKFGWWWLAFCKPVAHWIGFTSLLENSITLRHAMRWLKMAHVFKEHLFTSIVLGK